MENIWIQQVESSNKYTTKKTHQLLLKRLCWPLNSKQGTTFQDQKMDDAWGIWLDKVKVKICLLFIYFLYILSNNILCYSFIVNLRMDLGSSWDSALNIWYFINMRILLSSSISLYDLGFCLFILRFALTNLTWSIHISLSWM